MGVNEALGFCMLLGMIAVIFIGFPISFTLLFLALVFGGFGLGWEQTFNLAYLQIWGTMKDEIFPAVPLFISSETPCANSMKAVSGMTPRSGHSTGVQAPELDRSSIETA